MSAIRLRIVSCFVFVITAAVFADDNVATSASNSAPPKSTPGWVVVEEDIWLRFSDEPSHHLHQAHESFIKQKYKAAANDVVKAAGYVHIAAQNAASGTKAALIASAQELDRLAKDIKSGAVTSVKKLESAFARAEHALAAHYQAKARSALRQKKHASAGHYLRSAVNHVENGAKWTGHKLESGVVAAASGVRTVAGKLVEGSGFVLDEVGKGVEWVGVEVEKLGKQLEPRQKTDSVAKPSATKG
ncbi:MAG: hypothetical protein KDB27_10510 [Planctomycetales bacterium]|nr:hypothetical protein [Planctomycetales bacterium]